MAQNYGLGRGLSSLIPSNKKEEETQQNFSKRTISGQDENSIRGDRFVIEVDINNIVPNPHQPRIFFDEEKLQDLADSIKHHGIIQPLIVSHNGARYELIAGERRLQASKKAGLKKVPVIVRDANEKQKLELAIIENVQRHDLNAVEEAKSYKKLMEDYQMNQEEVADKIGKSRSLVANKVRLLALPIEIQKALIAGKISEGHAKAILSLENPQKQLAAFEMITKNGLTVRQSEDKIKQLSQKSILRKSIIDPQIKKLEDKLVEKFGTKVRITKSGKGGRIVVEYYSSEELDSILKKIG